MIRSSGRRSRDGREPGPQVAAQPRRRPRVPGGPPGFGQAPPGRACPGPARRPCALVAGRLADAGDSSLGGDSGLAGGRDGGGGPRLAGRQAPGGRDGKQQQARDRRHGPARARQRRDEPGQCRPSQRGRRVGPGVQRVSAGQPVRIDDARELGGPAAGERGGQEPGQHGHRDHHAQRQAAEGERDGGQARGVAGQRPGQQPPRPRAAVQQRADHRAARRGGNREPGVQHRRRLRRPGDGQPEQQQGRR